MKTGYIWILFRNIDSFKTRIYITKMTSISKSSQCMHETFRFGVGFKAGAVESRRLVPVQHIQKSRIFKHCCFFSQHINRRSRFAILLITLDLCNLCHCIFIPKRDISNHQLKFIHILPLLQTKSFPLFSLVIRYLSVLF